MIDAPHGESIGITPFQPTVGRPPVRRTPDAPRINAAAHRSFSRFSVCSEHPIGTGLKGSRGGTTSQKRDKERNPHRISQPNNPKDPNKRETGNEKRGKKTTRRQEPKHRLRHQQGNQSLMTQDSIQRQLYRERADRATPSRTGQAERKSSASPGRGLPLSFASWSQRLFCTHAHTRKHINRVYEWSTTIHLGDHH